MAASKEFIICFILTLLLCTFFMRVESSAADIRGGCGSGDGSFREDNERCVEKVKDDDDDDDVDDVFKVIKKLRIYA
ncbi:hypothetical protein Bca4012_001848 [Brassica carinata]|uniref:Uncharacterized protein n=4 Tax=Brassica TaxID=3705 RepID=A0A8S9P9I0_BRACR|nr:protein RALF-like 17 [Brassica napus]KAF3512129.1 hypothetical protein F2Q69_00001546 [Brassica cretica]KAG2296666.1 hypothetical protein Bca52824_043335 [Brassica carinata]CAF1699804.1 unnamed protein product [Brassica napus]VDC88841.1 unnamed protein product [Brassica oleracea]